MGLGNLAYGDEFEKTFQWGCGNQNAVSAPIVNNFDLFIRKLTFVSNNPGVTETTGPLPEI